MKQGIGLQLYTVRELITAKGFDAVVRQVAAIGFEGVETAGFPGTTAAAAAKLFRELNLKVCSGHFPLPLGEQKHKVLDDAKTIGCSRLVSGKSGNDFKTVDLIKQSCSQFNEAAAVAAENGMTFAIHNHWWEFEKVDGRPVYEIMLEQLDSSVLFEVDVYWVQTAGDDPVQILKRLGKRAPLLHIKDGPCERGKPMTAVGDGKVNIRAVRQASSQTAEWLIVELDECATDMLEAVRRSYQFLTSTNPHHGK